MREQVRLRGEPAGDVGGGGALCQSPFDPKRAPKITSVRKRRAKLFRNVVLLFSRYSFVNSIFYFCRLRIPSPQHPDSRAWISSRDSSLVGSLLICLKREKAFQILNSVDSRAATEEHLSKIFPIGEAGTAEEWRLWIFDLAIVKQHFLCENERKLPKISRRLSASQYLVVIYSVLCMYLLQKTFFLFSIFYLILKTDGKFVANAREQVRQKKALGCLLNCRNRKFSRGREGLPPLSLLKYLGIDIMIRMFFRRRRPHEGRTRKP